MLPKVNLLFFKKIDVTYIKIIFKDKSLLYQRQIIHSIHVTGDIDVQTTSIFPQVQGRFKCTLKPRADAPIRPSAA